MERSYGLVISCPDQVGIAAAVSEFVANHQGWITEAHRCADQASQCVLVHDNKTTVFA